MNPETAGASVQGFLDSDDPPGGLRVDTSIVGGLFCKIAKPKGYGTSRAVRSDAHGQD